MPLLTAAEVATWAQLDVADFGAFETMVIDQAQQLVAQEAKHAEWYDTTPIADVPFRARLIALNLARRTIVNPNQVLQEGSIGPIGGDRVRDAAALAMELSDAERAELHGLRGDGTMTSGLWVLPTDQSDRILSDIYVFDESGSDWGIPFATVGGTGEADADGEF